MGNIDEYFVSAGFYSDLGCTEEEPGADGTATTYATGLGGLAAGTTNGDKCPINKECKLPFPHTMDCEDGYISLETGLSQCAACSVGSYCDMQEDATKELRCITQSVCDGNVKRQPICPSGTFMNEGEQYCQMCIAGSYCRAGIIAD